MQNLIVTKSEEIYGGNNILSNQVVYYIDDKMVKFRTEIDGKVETITIKQGDSKEYNTQEKTVTENGEYTPDEGYDALSKVIVDVPEPILDEIEITENGEYTPTGDGYSKVTVNVPEPILEEKTVIENGEVLPSEGYDALSKVTVNVPDPELEEIEITENGEYEPSAYGYSKVIVDVPDPILDEIEITENGEYIPTGDGFSKVTVNVPSSGGGGNTDYNRADIPLCFTAIADDTVIKKNLSGTLYYTRDIENPNWQNLTDTGITLNEGETVFVKGSYTFSTSNKTSVVTIDKPVICKGNIASLVLDDYGEALETKTNTTAVCLAGAFYETPILTAPYCNVKLANYAFRYTFYNCICLATVPELPQTTLAMYCYSSMFYGCTSLTKAPELPATKMANNCYSYMFQGCSKLTTAPELPAKSLEQYCYSGMFYGCTSLETAPALPATTLAPSCYYMMFRNCSLLTTAPELPAKSLTQYCYNYMFNGCSKLNYIKAMFTNTPGTYYTDDWVDKVSSTGTFVKNSAATWTTTGIRGVPTGWAIEYADE